MKNTWQNWFRQDDSTPRVRYLTLAGKSELVLTHIQDLDEWLLTIRLDMGNMLVQKEIRFVPEELNEAGIEYPEWENMQPLAEETAKAWIGRLKAITSDCLATLEA